MLTSSFAIQAAGLFLKKRSLVVKGLSVRTDRASDNTNAMMNGVRTFRFALMVGIAILVVMPTLMA